MSSMLTQELFWKGYAIWKKGKDEWQTSGKRLSPTEWKKYNSKKKKKGKNTRNKIEKIEYQCQNPFHFLKKLRLITKTADTMFVFTYFDKNSTTQIRRSQK